MSEDARLERLGLLHLKDKPEELERRNREFDERFDTWEKERARRRADVARQRLRAYLEGTMDDPGYVPEDLLMRDVWILEDADFDWLLAEATSPAFDDGRRWLLRISIRDADTSRQLSDTIARTGRRDTS